MRKLIFAAIAATMVTGAHASIFNFTAALNGWQEVPQTGSPGIGTLVLAMNDANFTLSGSGQVDFLIGGQITGFHIHNAPWGQNGPIVQDLGTNSIFGAGQIGFTIQLTQTNFNNLLNLMNSGATYANIHTQQFPSGEIRGQITPVPEPATMAVLGLGALAAIRRRRAK